MVYVTFIWMLKLEDSNYGSPIVAWKILVFVGFPACDIQLIEFSSSTLLAVCECGAGGLKHLEWK